MKTIKKLKTIGAELLQNANIKIGLIAFVITLILLLTVA